MTQTSQLVDELRRLDLAVYRAVAATPTPQIDGALRRLSQAANHSKLSMAAAAAMALAGGARGRRAAVVGLASVAVTSASANLVAKLAWQRARPDREAGGVVVERHVTMPTSSSFPSGHSAAAFAFATGVSHEWPAVGVPLRGLAAVVAYSRVHTGVHYPSDAIAGGIVGGAMGQTVAVLARRLR